MDLWMGLWHPAAMPTLDIPSDLTHALRQARRMVVFTGAGVSAESGIPTFRDALTGLWSRFDPTVLATAQGFLADPDLVWGWYECRRLAVRHAQPNPAHQAIAQLSQQVPQLALVTQNVDDLHERAGNAHVLHLHGSLHQPRCFDCKAPFAVPAGQAATRARNPAQAFDAVDLLADGQRLPPPLCPACGGLIRPGVVWFGEALPADALEAAFHAAEHCDVLLSVGTSGVVEPAAGIPRAAVRAGAWVVHINPEAMVLGHPREWLAQGPAGAVLPQLLSVTRNPGGLS